MADYSEADYEEERKALWEVSLSTIASYLGFIMNNINKAPSLIQHQSLISHSGDGQYASRYSSSNSNNKDLAQELEEMVQKLEGDVRVHIRIE